MVVKNLYSTKTSKVFQAVHKASGVQLALKCYSKAHMMDLQKIQAVREIWFHSHLFHPYIISLYAAWMERGQICLAIEYAPIGSAFRKLRKLGCFPEVMSAKYVIYPILCSLSFLHEMGLMHRDIKPENVRSSLCSLLSRLPVVRRPAQPMHPPARRSCSPRTAASLRTWAW